MLSEGRVGPIIAADGSTNPYRQGKTGEIVSGLAHADYYEAVSRGRVFAAANQSGITTQAGLSATTPALTLYNPLGSGVLGVLIYAGATLSVANAAAAVVWVAANTAIAAAAVTGTLSTAVRSMYLGSSKNPTLQALLAATLPAAPVAVATLGAGLTGAITTVPGVAAFAREFKGSLIVAPGTTISFQTSTASGANSFFGEFVWEEVELSE